MYLNCGGKISLYQFAYRFTLNGLCPVEMGTFELNLIDRAFFISSDDILVGG